MLDVEKCTHPTVMKDLCADCGMDLRSDEDPQVNIASVPMIHSVPELKVIAKFPINILFDRSRYLFFDVFRLANNSPKNSGRKTAIDF